MFSGFLVVVSYCYLDSNLVLSYFTSVFYLKLLRFFLVKKILASDLRTI
jgi:hypothetical protein